MKKTMLSLLLALSLLLSACGAAPVSTTAPAQTAVPAVSTVPAEPATEPATEAPTPENSERASVFTTDGTISMLSGSERMLAVSMMASDDRTGLLVTLDPATGAKLSETEIPDPHCTMMIFSGGIATWNFPDNTLRVYSDELELLWSRSFPQDQYGNLQTDDSFYLYPGENLVTRISLTDQSEQSVTLPEGMIPSSVTQCRDNQSMILCTSDDYSESYYFLIDWPSGELGAVAPRTSISYSAYTSYYGSGVYGSHLYLNLPELPMFYRISGEELWPLDSDADRALVEQDCESLLYCDLTDGSIRSLPTVGTSGAVLCGSLAAFTEMGNSNEVFVWNPAFTQPGTDTVEEVDIDDLCAENEQLAAEIEAHTGLEIFYGESGTLYNNTVESGYGSDTVLDPLLNAAGLEQLKLVTDAYPDGMFLEMTPNPEFPTEVYLCGSIHGDQYGFDPAAFANYMDDRQIVVLDITNIWNPEEFRATIVHEFLHIMENHITDYGWENGYDFLTYWMSFAPDPDVYFYNYSDYLDYDGNPDNYTTASGLPADEILFLDSYSRTMPTEDRARILEHLYLGENSPYADYLQEGVLKEKAEYLCAMIRECFPSCRIEGRLPWENGVDIVPFSDYIDDMRAYQPQAVG